MKLAIRRPQDCCMVLGFMFVVLSLFPLAVSSTHLLHVIAPGMIWVVALLATLLSLDRLFREDAADGSLQQLLLMPTAITPLIFAKIMGHWMIVAVPLLLLSPLFGMMYGVSWHGFCALFFTLLIGTPILSFIGAIGAALTVGLPNSSLLLFVTIIPLYIPILIFGTTCVYAAEQGLPVMGYFALLGALLILAITLTPIVCAVALRISLDY